MKDLDAGVTTELDAQQKKPRLLVELYLTGLTLRFCTGHSVITFPHGGATTYTPKDMKLDSASHSIEGQVVRASVTMDNISGDMSGYANSYTFEGRKLVIKRIFLDSDNNAPAAATEYDELFRGKLERIKDFAIRAVKISGTTGKPLRRKALLDVYGRACRHRAGYGQCNQDGLFDLTALTASGTADSGTTSTLVHSALTEADDFWNYGDITITKGGITYNRKVKDFDAATDTITFDLALPVAVDATTTYVVNKGCDKTWDTCQANNAWGPSADNKLNFGGNIHVGKAA